MDETILRIDRCECCGLKTQYYVRGLNVNVGLTDSDIRRIVTAKLEQPHSFDHCNDCKMSALTTTVGWIGFN